MVICETGLEEKKMPVTRSQKSYAVKRTTDEKSAVSTTRSADATEYASALGATTGGTSGPQPPSEPTTETLQPPLLPPCPIVVAGVTTAVAPTAAVSAAIDSVESTTTKQGRSRLSCSSRSSASRARRRELALARLELLERRKEAAIAKAEAAMFDVELAASKVAALEEDSEEEQIEGSIYESRSSKNGTSHPPSLSRAIGSRARRRELQARLELLEQQKKMAKANALVAIAAAKAKAEEEELKAELAEAKVSALEEEIQQARVRRSTLARASQEVTTCQVPPEPAGNVVASGITPEPAKEVAVCQVHVPPEPAEDIIACENRREPQRYQPLQRNSVAPVNSVTSTSETVSHVPVQVDSSQKEVVDTFVNKSATAEPVSIMSEGPTSLPSAEVVGALTPSIDTTKDHSLENREMSVSAIKTVHLSQALDIPTDSKIDRHALPFLEDKPKGLPAGETELLRKVVSNSKCDLAVRRLDLIDKRLTDKYWARWMEKYVRDSQQQGDVMNPAGAYHGDDRGAAHRRRCRDRG